MKGMLQVSWVIALCAQNICSGQEIEPATDAIVLSGATVILGTEHAPIENGVIAIEGDRIVWVGRAEDADLDDSLVIDLKDRFVVPGFFDMHAHIQAGMERPLLAFGITTIRNPGSSGSEGIPFRNRLNTGDLLGPRMYTAGPTIDNAAKFDLTAGQQAVGDTGVGTSESPPPEVSTVSQMVEEVRRQAEAGFDAVKLYMGIEPPLVRAAVTAAHEQDVPVIGHLELTSWTEAAENGIDTLVHSCSEGPTWELLDESEREKHDWRTFPTTLRSWASTADMIALSGQRWESLISALITSSAEVNPTLVTLESLYWADDASHLASEQPDFAPDDYADRWSANWQAQANMMHGYGFSTGDFDSFKSAFVACQRMVRALHDRRVLITAGTDVGGWMTPGVSFHRELQLLADAGISNMDVIRIATHNGALALGVLADVGTIEPGKRADLVILYEDPLEEIRHTQSIQSVVHDGVIYDPGYLLGD